MLDGDLLARSEDGEALADLSSGGRDVFNL